MVYITLLHFSSPILYIVYYILFQFLVYEICITMDAGMVYITLLYFSSPILYIVYYISFQFLVYEICITVNAGMVYITLLHFSLPTLYIVYHSTSLPVLYSPAQHIGEYIHRHLYYDLCTKIIMGILYFISPSFLWRFSGFFILIFATRGKYQNMEKPLKHQRRLGLVLH